MELRMYGTVTYPQPNSPNGTLYIIAIWSIPINEDVISVMYRASMFQGVINIAQLIRVHNSPFHLMYYPRTAYFLQSR